MSSEITIITEDNIKDKIYIIRGIKVMLDSDLAEIYGYSTKDFNRQVKNNIERFDNDFRFELSEEEYNNILRCKNFTSSTNLRSQFMTSNENNNHGGRRYKPFVFTEQGIYMLMTVLKGEKAIIQSKTLIRLFKKMKDYIIDNIPNYEKELFIMQHKITNIDNKLTLYDSKFDILFNNFNEKNNYIFYEGEYYDSYSILLDILNKAKESIIIIDNYTNKDILDLICKLKIEVTIISKNMDSTLIKKYQKQYNNLTIIQNSSFHDRFIIIDNKNLYHIGSSLKDIGKKCFSINKITEKEIINNFLDKIKNEL